MKKRLLHPIVIEYLSQFPAVTLLGPRQVGKTTLAHQILDTQKGIYLDLESPADLSKLDDAESYLQDNQDKLVIIDEVHRMPGLFKILRGVIDKARRGGNVHGQFLLLGSASIELLKQSSESLAGRIANIELSPFNILETGQSTAKVLWLRGGFPDSFLANSDSLSHRWREQFIRSYLERDIPDLGPRIPSETMRRLWTMLAHNQGQLINNAQMAKGLDIAGKTVARYLDLLVDLLLVYRLEPWLSNAGKRLVKSPKIYIRDSGVTHALLGIGNYDSLLGHPIVGSSWEGFILGNIMSILPEGTQTGFYRTSAGAEIDLVIKFPDGIVWAIEIKLSTAPKVNKGFHIACEPDRRILVYSGSDSYTQSGDIQVMGLHPLMKLITN